LYKDNELGILLGLLEASDDINKTVSPSLLNDLKLTEQDISEIKFLGLNWLADQQDVYKNL
jgi:EAL and modified HD-GYP domain-containing signal transduction protein